MPIRIDMGTDIARLGLWDPEPTPMDLRGKPPGEINAIMEDQAKAGRLFFINTGGDGSFLTDIYVNEPPDAELLGAYVQFPGPFLIQSESGSLVAGGLEDFGSNNPQVTTDADRLDIAPGRYALRFYELDDDRLFEQLKDHVGEEDMAYYSSRQVGCLNGCGFFALGIVLLVVGWVLLDSVPWLWLGGLGLVTGSVVWGVTRTVIEHRKRAEDERYQAIAGKIDEFTEPFVPFIFVLEPAPADADIEGGWVDLI